ncbi:MAG: hypothetical protein HY821_06690 [Acidobacteria bacterium]|nr:hypothetical protein [Acidobacteriota bacterium]
MSSLADTLEKLKKLDDERAKLLESSKSALLNSIKDNLAALSDLGFDYDLVASGSAPRARSSKSAAKPSGRVCSICGQSGHNSRTCPKKK